MVKQRKSKPPGKKGVAAVGKRHAGKPNPALKQANALIPRIVALLTRGQAQQALSLIESGMQLAPDHPEFAHLAGQVIRGPTPADKQEARRWLKRAVDLSPRNPQYAVSLAYACLADDELEPALKWARHAVRADTTFVEAHTVVGLVLVRLKRQREAAEAFSNAVRLQPKNPDVWKNLALCRMELREPDGVVHAVSQLEKLVNDPPAALLVELGEIYRGIGEHSTARRYLQKATEKDPASAEGWFRLGYVLAEAGAYDDAVDALARAERLGYYLCAIRFIEGRILGQKRRVEDAKGKLEEALELAKDDIEHVLKISREFAQLGDFEAQVRCLNRALEIDPKNVSAFAALASAPGRVVDQSQLVRLEGVAKDPAVDADTRSRVAFTLGNNYRYAENFDRSFRYYQLGNKLKGFRFDEVAYLDWQHRVEAAFTKERLAQRSAGGNPSRLPVLIVGMPRSGTTLTEQIISSHPRIYGAGELGSVASLASIADVGSISFENPIDQLIDANDEQLAEYAANYLRSMVAEAGNVASHVTNKLPHNFQQVGLFALLFPQAPVIHIKRDPRDNLLSLYFQDFSTVHQYAYDLKSLGRYYRLYEQLMQHWAAVLPNPMFELHYEELVADLPGKTAELASFIGVDLDEHMLRFWEQERKVVTASKWQVRQPLYSSSVGRWKPYEKHLRPLLQELQL